jgi:hypothetical protein
MFNIAIPIVPIGFIADTFQTDRLCSDRFHTDTFHTDMFCLGTVKKGSDFPLPSRDVTNLIKLLPFNEILVSDIPAGAGKSLTFFTVWKELLRCKRYRSICTILHRSTNNSRAASLFYSMSTLWMG